jgi:hypothetical protein
MAFRAWTRLPRPSASAEASRCRAGLARMAGVVGGQVYPSFTISLDV